MRPGRCANVLPACSLSGLPPHGGRVGVAPRHTRAASAPGWSCWAAPALEQAPRMLRRCATPLALQHGGASPRAAAGPQGRAGRHGDPASPFPTAAATTPGGSASSGAARASPVSGPAGREGAAPPAALGAPAARGTRRALVEELQSDLDEMQARRARGAASAAPLYHFWSVTALCVCKLTPEQASSTHTLLYLPAHQLARCLRGMGRPAGGRLVCCFQITPTLPAPHRTAPPQTERSSDQRGPVLQAALLRERQRRRRAECARRGSSAAPPRASQENRPPGRRGARPPPPPRRPPDAPAGARQRRPQPKAAHGGAPCMGHRRGAVLAPWADPELDPAGSSTAASAWEGEAGGACARCGALRERAASADEEAAALRRRCQALQQGLAGAAADAGGLQRRCDALGGRLATAEEEAGALRARCDGLRTQAAAAEGAARAAEAAGARGAADAAAAVRRANVAEARPARRRCQLVMSGGSCAERRGHGLCRNEGRHAGLPGT